MRKALGSLLLVSLLLAGCSGGGGSDDGTDGGSNGGNGGSSGGTGPSVGAPTFTLNDRWVEGTTTNAGKVPTDRRVMAFETLQTSKGPVDTVRLDSQQQAGVLTDIKQWVRVSDHAAVKMETSGTVQGYSYSTTTTWDPPCESYDWPLQAGKSWTTTCTATTSGSVGGGTTTTTSMRYTVHGIEEVTVPSGTFQAYNITVETTTNGQTTTQSHYYSAKACNVVKITGPGYLHELESYVCAKGA